MRAFTDIAYGRGDIFNIHIYTGYVIPSHVPIIAIVETYQTYHHGWLLNCGMCSPQKLDSHRSRFLVAKLFLVKSGFFWNYGMYSILNYNYVL